MAGTIVEWAAFFLFILLFVGSIIAEVRWLTGKGWTTSGRATGFVILTDMLGLCIGGAIVLTAFVIMFMMVMGPAGRGGDSPESAYWVVTALAIIFPPLLLILSKRLFLLIFKIRSGGSAWLYSLVSSLAVILLVVVPPPLILYLVTTIWKL